MTESYFLLMCEYGNVDVVQAMVSTLYSSNPPPSANRPKISKQLVQQACNLSLLHGHVNVAQKLCLMTGICPDLSFVPSHIAANIISYCDTSIYDNMHLFADGTLSVMSSINISNNQIEKFWPNVLSYLSTVAVSGPQWLKEWHIEILLQEYKQSRACNIQYLVNIYGLSINP